MVLVVKNPPAIAGDERDPSVIPGLERSPGGQHGNPLQYSIQYEFNPVLNPDNPVWIVSCLENPMDRGE